MVVRQLTGKLEIDRVAQDLTAVIPHRALVDSFAGAAALAAQLQRAVEGNPDKYTEFYITYQIITPPIL